MKALYKIFTLQFLAFSTLFSSVLHAQVTPSTYRIDIQKTSKFNLAQLKNFESVSFYSSIPMTKPILVELEGNVSGDLIKINIEKSANIILDKLAIGKSIGAGITNVGTAKIELLSLQESDNFRIDCSDGSILTIKTLQSTLSSGGNIILKKSEITIETPLNLEAFSSINASVFSTFIANKTVELGNAKDIYPCFFEFSSGSEFKAASLNVVNSSIWFSDSEMTISVGDLSFKDDKSSVTLNTSRLEVEGDLIKNNLLPFNLSANSYLKVRDIKAFVNNSSKDVYTFQSAQKGGCSVVQAANYLLPNELFSNSSLINYYNFKMANAGMAVLTDDPSACVTQPKFIPLIEDDGGIKANIGDSLVINGVHFPTDVKDLQLFLEGIYDANGQPAPFNDFKILSKNQIKIQVPYTRNVDQRIYFYKENASESSFLLKTKVTFIDSVGDYTDLKPFWVYGKNLKGIDKIAIKLFVNSDFRYDFASILNNNSPDSTLISYKAPLDCKTEIAALRTQGEPNENGIIWISGIKRDVIQIKNAKEFMSALPFACPNSTFIFETGNYNLSGLQINENNKNITLVGKNGVVFIGTESANPMLMLQNAGTIKISNITITNADNIGNLRAGLARTLGVVPSGVGGAILAQNGTNLVLENMTFEGNKADFSGGAIAVYNTNDLGTTGSIPSLTIKGNVRFGENSAGSSGGAIYVHNAANIFINDAAFTKNFTIRNDENSQGAAICFRNNHSDSIKINITNSLFNSNYHIEKGDGGAIAFDNSLTTSIFTKITKCKFNDNKANNGAAIFSNIWKLTLDTCDFTNNNSQSEGGAILLTASETNMNNCLFEKNIAYTNGGAIALVNSSGYSCIIERSSFIENTAGIYGGALYSDGGNITSSYCSILKNEAKNDGGGVYLIGNESSSNFTHLTIARNIAKTSSGGLVLNDANIRINNCAIGENLTSAGDVDNQYSTSPNLYFNGKNLITTSFSTLKTDNLSNYLVTISPLDKLYLEPNYTTVGNQKFYKPLSFSPLIDKAEETITTFSNSSTIGTNRVSFDQIGNRKKGELLDLGAIEYIDNINPLHITTTVDSLVNGSIRGAEIFSNYKKGSDTITFDASIVGKKIMLEKEVLFDSKLYPQDSVKTLFFNGDNQKIIIGRKDILETGVTPEFNLLKLSHTSKVKDIEFDGLANGKKNIKSSGLLLNEKAKKSIIENIVSKNNGRGVSSKADSVRIFGSSFYGNQEFGIAIFENSLGKGTIIQGNTIGVDRNLVKPISGVNNGIAGIAYTHQNVLIGGLNISQGNTIAGNDSIGVLVVGNNSKILNNKIGLASSPNKVAIDFASFGSASNGTTVPIQNSLSSTQIGSINAFNIISNNKIGINMPNVNTNTGSIFNNTWAYNSFITNDTATKIINNTKYQVGLQAPTNILEKDSIIRGKATPYSYVHIYLDRKNNAEFYVDSTLTDLNGNFFYDLKKKKGKPTLPNFTLLQNYSSNSSPLTKGNPIGCENFRDSLGIDSSYVFCKPINGVVDGILKLGFDQIKTVQWYSFDSGDFKAIKDSVRDSFVVKEDGTKPLRYYYARVTLNNGCELNSDTAVVKFKAYQVIAARIKPEGCFGSKDGEITINNVLTKNDGLKFYKSGFLIAPLVASPNSIFKLDSGKYTVELKSEGCVYTKDITVASPDKMEISLTPVDPIECGKNNGSIVINYKGLSQISHVVVFNSINSKITFTPSLINKSITIPELVAGSYQNIHIKTNQGSLCKSDSFTVSLIDPNAPTINAGIDKTICKGEFVTLLPDNPGNAKLTWSNDVNDSIPFAPATSIEYVVTADKNGCKSFDAVKITVNPLPVLSIAASNTIICANTPITLTARGASTYIWDKGAQNAVPLNLNKTTLFTVTGTDINACEAKASITIDVKSVSVNNALARDTTIVLKEDISSLFDLQNSAVNPLTYILLYSTKNISLALEGNRLSFNPNLNFNGLDTLQYKVTDNNCTIDSAYISLNVLPVNDAPYFTKSPPVFNTLTIPDYRNPEKSKNIIDGVADVDADKLIAVNIKSNFGNVIYNTADNTFTYLLKANSSTLFPTKDTVKYSVCDVGRLCVDAELYVNIFAVPKDSIEKIILVGADLSLPTTVLNVKPSNNNTIINVLNGDKYNYLRFKKLKYNGSDTALLVNIEGNFLPSKIEDSVAYVEYQLCDNSTCGEVQIMVLRFAREENPLVDFDFIDGTLDLSKYTNTDIKKLLEIIPLNTAVSNGYSLRFKFTWDDKEISNADSLVCKLTILSRWGDEVYKESGKGKIMNWFGQYVINGKTTDEKVEDGNYFWVLSIKYLDSENKTKEKFATGNLYYLNRDIK